MTPLGLTLQELPPVQTFWRERGARRWGYAVMDLGQYPPQGLLVTPHGTQPAELPPENLMQ